MHVTLSVPIQIEAFGRKLFSGICNSKNAFFGITFCHTVREVEEFREFLKIQ